MKTAISIPDNIFREAESAASRLGISRSEFFTRAAKSYIRAVDEESLTFGIDAALARIGDHDTKFVTEASRRALKSDGDGW
ncbi:CopG family transcriptional regulator [Paeniglutamicibacter psychrophenolicus]|uniref:CopG family transcriptional regulator n=1 Tax=Paeniglutamicibacter psychrophenolicus TaxID=257454 RepID=UPI00277E8D90|nr:CopG family transcriptional regulator [Paeniglutamicibacter psychrophenolicus]MDQ0094616.1 metal-responsive CopG/Arc/MetJ family transcriptional regulator [Paeniglutamicibacter psychrophenolicus]